MRCPSCNGTISDADFLRPKTCPACGGKIKRMPTNEEWGEIGKSYKIFYPFAGMSRRDFRFWSKIALVVILFMLFAKWIIGL